jgi:protein-S-isoprenylcysteine O-methyltransferase Ste14
VSQERKKHDTRPSGTPAAGTHRPSLLPLPQLVYLVAIATGLGLHAYYPLPWIGRPMSDILFAVGCLALLAAIALFITALRAMRRAGTSINPNAPPTHLVTDGPFGISRNPIYLGDALVLIGIGLVWGIAWFLPLTLVAAFITRKVAIEREERWLLERFGKRFRDYRDRVRRWI